MAVGRNQQTPEQIGQALLAALKSAPHASLDERIKLSQQFLPPDILKEIDGDEDKSQRLLAAAVSAGGSDKLYYHLTLFYWAEREGCTGFLFRGAGKETCQWLLAVLARSLERKEANPEDLQYTMEAVRIAQAIGDGFYETAGWIVQGVLDSFSPEMHNMARVDLTTALILLPQAEAQLRAANDSDRLATLQKSGAMAARTLLLLIPDL